MVNDVYKLSLTMTVMKEQRQKMIADFTNQPDYLMLQGLYRFQHPAEYQIYTELYHVLWVDRHWNRLLDFIDSSIELQEDRLMLERYFAGCFLKLVENIQMQQNITPMYIEVLRIKAHTLKEMIAIVQKAEQYCAELEHAQDYHKRKYQAMLDQYLIKS